MSEGNEQFVTVMPVSSSFSKAVFKEIRPGIARQFWPNDAVRAVFTPAANGLYLNAAFSRLPPPQAEQAARLVAQAGFVLVRESPVALLAAEMLRVQRLRNIAMFAAVPLLFAIPLMFALSPQATRAALMLFAADTGALLLLQFLLTVRRARLVAGQFHAEIPTPGMRIKS